MTNLRRPLTVAVATTAALACALPAIAAWTATSSGATATAKASALQPVTALTPSAAATSVALSWAAPVAGAEPSGYTVTRTAPSTATVCTNAAATTCTDSGLTANTAYSYSVVAVRGSWSSTPVTANATTLSLGAPNFAVTVSGSATAGVAKSVTVTARNGTTTDTAYTGAKTLTFGGAGSSPFGDAPTASASVVFVGGVGTAPVTFTKAETIAAFTVTEGTRTGSSAVTVVPGAATRLRFTGSSVRTGNSGTTFTSTACLPGDEVLVGNGGIFRSKVSVADAYGNVVTNGAVARTVTIARSAVTTGSLTTSGLGSVAANANPAETAGTFDYTHGTGSPPDNVITAASAGLTPVTCTIAKD